MGRLTRDTLESFKSGSCEGSADMNKSEATPPETPPNIEWYTARASVGPSESCIGLRWGGLSEGQRGNNKIPTTWLQVRCGILCVTSHLRD